ncbi:MAG: nitroreductase family protein [Chloroflexi bacterium]|nr:nitroreductase family protein [Chloroflexota bacterium]MCI0779856.1 nitroreductase family protein [Chloroflexota bacterium]MCI0858198.1 nitroreductase family protein [Chloroflexota bacterium]MCI0865458.1 nitroreductase family protein [Chloroflexota bacterium]
MTDISLFDAIHSQRAIRHFSADPVSGEAITTILEAAIRAPSGGNRQRWSFLVIRDRETKRRLGQWYFETWNALASAMDLDSPGGQPYRPSMLTDGMEDIPVLILACQERPAAGFGPHPITSGASIYPAVQNIMLAARALGLGTVLTTLHTQHEQDVKALLGIPENVDTAALIPVGYPAKGRRFGGSKRNQVGEVTFHEMWGQKAAQ